MGKRAPRLPVASAERERITISDSDWQRVESVYGQKLSPGARRDIHEKTQEFVDRAEFERHAERMSDARNRISTIVEAASSLRSALDGGNHDADIYARTLIKKHLRKEGAAKKHLRKEGDATKKRRRKKRDPLRKVSSDMRLLIFRSQDALRELDDTKDQGFSKGEAWDRWIGRLTSIAGKHGLLWRVRKDVVSSDRPSPFVKLVWELQKFVPKAHRRDHSKSALAVAIVAARSRNRVG
jgi:hypothetical protein